MDFHVFAQRRGMSVRLVAAIHLAVIWLVRSVDVRVLLAVRGVGEAPVAALELTFKRFLACK